MPHDWNDLVAAGVDRVMRLCRLPGLNRPGVYALQGLAPIQPLLERVARRRAVAAFRRARARCPAYRQFLHRNGFTTRADVRTFPTIPETNKHNYIKPFPIEDRCFNGRIPRRGVVIDESSGSSGEPNNWVRGRGERASVRRILQHGYALTFHDRANFLINCFALGPWATGMNVTMSMADALIVKSVGPDRQKLENTLRTFGTRYTYAIAGYPPFIKDFIAATALDLASYDLHLLVGGEGISEGLRDRFLEVFKSVHSSYGASDLEINIAAETPLSIAVRRLCVADTALCQSLFGRDDPPMLFQYGPLDYLIEGNADGELCFTLLRPGYAAPKIRYNLRDAGGVITHRALMQRLAEHGVDPAALPRSLAFPFLYIGGRTDLTVPFYGAKIFTSDMDAVLNADPTLREHFHSFQMRTTADEEHNEILHIALERTRASAEGANLSALRDTLIEGLKRVNQDFREVSRMFPNDRVLVEVHDFGAGPFATRDIRVKQRYIAP